MGSASQDKTIKLWNINDLTLNTTLDKHTNEVYSLTYVNNTNELISSGTESYLNIWNLATKTIER